MTEEQKQHLPEQAKKAPLPTYDPWKIILKHLKENIYLAIALGLIVIVFFLLFLPFAHLSFDQTVNGIQETYSINYSGYNLMFGGDVMASDRIYDGSALPALIHVSMSGGIFAIFLFILIAFFLISFVYVEEKMYALAFIGAALLVLSGIFSSMVLPLCGFSSLSYDSNLANSSSTFTSESLSLNRDAIASTQVNNTYTIGIGAILVGIVLIAAAVLVIDDYFLVYTKAIEDNTFVTYRKDLVDNDILVSVRHLKMFFPMGQHKKLKAVHDVSFDIKKGECFGLVGESGCGKTTTGRSIIRLYHVTSGSIYFKGYRVAAGSRWNEKEIKWSEIHTKNKIKELRAQEAIELENSSADEGSDEGKAEASQIRARYDAKVKELQLQQKAWTKLQKQKIAQIKYDDSHVNRKLLSKMQMIFQDPIDSLDPRMTVEDIIQEGLKIQGYRNRAENHKKACQVLEEVGLIADYCSRYPNEFSGGQRQRIGIARAVVMNPEFLICDEPISALDVSIRAQIINLLNDLKVNHGLTLMFIAHDLSVVKYFCDRIAVMYFGELVEMASSDELFAHPLHPYTRALLSAIPKPDPYYEKQRKRIIYNPKTEHDYSKEGPKFTEIVPGHFVLANSAEIAKYREMIKEDDLRNAQQEEERKKSGTEY